MLTTYGESSQQHNQSWILYSGQLVRTKQNCFEQLGSIGIIIDCVYPDFGAGTDKWLVLVNGELNTLESFKLWPVEEK